MKKLNTMCLIALMIGLLTAFASTYAAATMAIFLRDGRVVNVPVNRDEILSISFDGPSATASQSTNPSLPVTDGLLMWLDASDMSTLFQNAADLNPVTAANQLVGLWKDKSGNENDLSQTKSDGRPSFVKTGIGGKPSLMFETSQSLSMKTNFPTPVTVIYVARQTGGRNQRVLQAVANNWLLGYWNGSKNQGYYEGWVSPSGGIATDNLQHVFSAIVKGPGQNSEIWADGTLVASNQNGVTGPNGLAINGGAYPGEASACQVAEIIVWNRAISQNERKDMEVYLRSKWGNKR